MAWNDHNCLHISVLYTYVLEERTIVVGRTKPGVIELGATGCVTYTECLGNIPLEGLPYDLLKHQDDDHFLRQRVMLKTPKKNVHILHAVTVQSLKGFLYKPFLLIHLVTLKKSTWNAVFHHICSYLAQEKSYFTNHTISLGFFRGPFFSLYESRGPTIWGFPSNYLECEISIHCHGHPLDDEPKSFP